MNIPEGWPTREMIDAAWRGYTGTNATEKLTRAVTAALAAAPTPPEVEPVTFVWSTTIREYLEKAVPDAECGDDWTKGHEECKRRILRMLQQPVNERFYVSPASDGLRKAAERAHRELCILGGSHNEVAMNLRVELDKKS